MLLTLSHGVVAGFWRFHFLFILSLTVIEATTSFHFKQKIFHFIKMSSNSLPTDLMKMKMKDRASVGSIEDEQAPSILMSTLSISDSSSLMDAASVDVSAKDAAAASAGDQAARDFEAEDLLSAGALTGEDLKAWNEHAVLVSMLRAYFETKKPGVSRICCSFENL